MSSTRLDARRRAPAVPLSIGAPAALDTALSTRSQEPIVRAADEAGVFPAAASSARSPSPAGAVATEYFIEGLAMKRLTLDAFGRAG